MRLSETPMLRLPALVQDVFRRYAEKHATDPAKLIEALSDLDDAAAEASREWDVHDHHTWGCDSHDKDVKSLSPSGRETSAECPCYQNGYEDGFEAPREDPDAPGSALDADCFPVSPDVLDALSIFQMTETPENAVVLALALVECRRRFDRRRSER